MLKSQARFLSSKQSCEPKSLDDVDLNIAVVENKLGELAEWSPLDWIFGWNEC